MLRRCSKCKPSNTIIEQLESNISICGHLNYTHIHTRDQSIVIAAGLHLAAEPSHTLGHSAYKPDNGERGSLQLARLLTPLTLVPPLVVAVDAIELSTRKVMSAGDTKYRAPSTASSSDRSRGNVVDHSAPNGEHRLYLVSREDPCIAVNLQRQ
ncbi:hypothetical protein BC629DRAFT_1504016 [Irpex lacteus]|nr:hypothetical protein BC629DRAFT_1504016 [Irpex lacteus]